MTEKWRRLGYADLREVLAQDELDKLDQLSLSSDVSAICESQLDTVADAFRYAFQTKGWTVDIRDHHIPNGYRLFVLNYARPQIWSRFPNSKEIAIDEIRKDLHDKAAEMLESPKIGIPYPDYSDDPELSGRTDLTAFSDASLTIPQLKLEEWHSNGFNEALVRYSVYGEAR